MHGLADAALTAAPYAMLTLAAALAVFALTVGIVLARDELVAWRATRPAPALPAPAPLAVPIVSESVTVIAPERAARLAATAVVLVAIQLVP